MEEPAEAEAASMGDTCLGGGSQPELRLEPVVEVSELWDGCTSHAHPQVAIEELETAMQFLGDHGRDQRPGKDIT